MRGKCLCFTLQEVCVQDELGCQLRRSTEYVIFPGVTEKTFNPEGRSQCIACNPRTVVRLVIYSGPEAVFVERACGTFQWALLYTVVGVTWLVYNLVHTCVSQFARKLRHAQPIVLGSL